MSNHETAVEGKLDDIRIVLRQILEEMQDYRLILDEVGKRLAEQIERRERSLS